MTFGEEGKEGARVHDLKDVEAILDVFQAHGHKEVNRSRSVIAIALLMCYEFKVDTAIAYCGGTSEQYLGKIGWQKRGLIMETKLYPNVVRLFASCLFSLEVTFIIHAVQCSPSGFWKTNYLPFSGGMILAPPPCTRV